MSEQLEFEFMKEIPDLKFVKPTEEYRSALEEIAMEASKFEPLKISFFSFSFGQKNALKTFDDMYFWIDCSLKFPEQYQYVIKEGDKAIGFISIHDGYDAVEREYSDPFVDIAFLHPAFSHYSEKVRKFINTELGGISNIVEGIKKVKKFS